MKALLLLSLAAVVPVAAQNTQQAARDEELSRALRDLVNLEVRVAGSAVKNAPFSAETSTTTTQVLGDGNRIEQSTSQKLYRDSQGRERREGSILGIGSWTDAPGTVSISDPVANLSYTINPRQHTARRTRAAVAGMTLNMGNTVINLNPGALTANGHRLTSADTTRTKEDLGSQTIEGVITQGTRTTETIAAGAIGNTLPINVVDEVWYSPELKMNIMTTHSDPRTGVVVYKVTNINRGEQPQSLFEPPADYSVTGPEPIAGRGGRGPAPAK